jgi:hypothetical protein
MELSFTMRSRIFPQQAAEKRPSAALRSFNVPAAYFNYA